MSTSDNCGNNLNINIPNLLAEKYPSWINNCPEIYQLNEELEPIKEWSNKKEIANFYGKPIQGVDLAIRKCCRFQGYYFVIKVLYEQEGLKPLLIAKRNQNIYAYNPPQEILDAYYDGKILSQDYFRKEGIKEKFQFIGYFKNSVSVSKYLDISITNIRQCVKGQLLLHKEYFFSFSPLLKIHEVIAIILYLSKKNYLNSLEKSQLVENIQLFKKLYEINTDRIINSTEEELLKEVYEIANKF